jgi:1,4-alpha-glucan branching enzyme
MQTRHNETSTAARSASPAANRTQPRPSEKSREKPIEFTLKMPQAKSACIAGTFNGWDSNKTPMRKDVDSSWKATLELASGRHEYRFVVDGQWISDPNAKETVRNQFGSTNSVVVV